MSSVIRTTCRLESGEWVINGHKLWGSAFRSADLYRVLCRVEGETYPKNIAQIYVPAKTPGLKTGKPYRKMGCSLDTNGDPSDFKNLIISDACKKTVGDLGFKAVNRALELMGSHGYSREGKMEKLLRDIKITQIWVGGPLLYLTELSRYYFGTKTI